MNKQDKQGHTPIEALEDKEQLLDSSDSSFEEPKNWKPATKNLPPVPRRNKQMASAHNSGLGVTQPMDAGKRYSDGTMYEEDALSPSEGGLLTQKMPPASRPDKRLSIPPPPDMEDIE